MAKRKAAIIGHDCDLFKLMVGGQEDMIVDVARDLMRGA